MRNWCKSLILVVCLLFLALGVQQAGAQAQDPDWQDKLSKRTYAEVKFRMHQVEMPDGIKLSAAILDTRCRRGEVPCDLDCYTLQQAERPAHR